MRSGRRTAAAGLGLVLATAMLCAPALAAAPADDVTARPPGPQDDRTRLYAVGDLWNLPGGGEWICVAADAGAARWRRLPPQKLPLDALDGVELHGWGTRRLSRAYRGPLLGVARPGDALVAIGAQADGDLDHARLARAIAAGNTLTPPQDGSIGVVAWSDQAARGAVDLTVPAGAVAPQIALSATTGGSPFVAFADGGMNWLTDAAGDATHIQHPRLSGRGLGADARDLSIVAVLRGGAAGNTIDSAIAFAGPYPIALNTQDITLTTPPRGGASLGDGAERGLGFYVPSTPSVLAIAADATHLSAFDDDLGRSEGPALTPNHATQGMILGGSGVTETGFADALSAIITGPALDASRMLVLRESLTALFRLTPQLRDRVVLAGASTEAGADGWLTQAPIRHAEAGLSRRTVIFNLAIGGASMRAPPGGANLIWPASAGTLYAPGARNVYVIGAGALINELGRGSSAEATIAALRLWLAWAHALGPSVRTVCETVMPHFALANEPKRAAVNAAIRDPATGCDAIADIAADSTLGAVSILSDRAWTVADGGHHSPRYQAREGALFAAAINAALSGSGPAPRPPSRPR